MSRLACLALVISATAACSSSDNNPPTQAQYDDTAQQLGSVVATGGGGGELGSMTDIVSIANGTSLPGFTANASGQVTGTHLGLTYDYMLTCKDAGGNTLPACTSATDSADASVVWMGMLALPNLTASVDRSGSWTVTGLQSSTAKFDGDGSLTLGATVTSLFRPATATYDFKADASYDDVLVDTATKAAIGGSIHYDVTASSAAQNTANGNSASTSFDLSADVAFAANGTATLTLDGSHTYTIDVSTGVVVKVN